MALSQLWFGDERGYNATQDWKGLHLDLLWFGDERGYNATEPSVIACATRCGLVMKEDITQHKRINHSERLVVVW